MLPTSSDCRRTCASETKRSPETVRITGAAKQEQGELENIAVMHVSKMLQWLSALILAAFPRLVGPLHCGGAERLYCRFAYVCIVFFWQQERQDMPTLGFG